MKVRAMNVSTITALGGRRHFACALGVSLSLLVSSAAWAQIGGTSPMGNNGRSGHMANTPDKPPEAAPNAIPGATPREPVAPATRAAADLQPTDALFDAINRGDITAARDALNRGADLNGVNILGMTPMELSVDLARNDISFLLLSMRGDDSDRGARAIGRDTPPSSPVTKTAHAGKPTGPSKHVVAGKDVPGRAAKVAKAENIPVAAKPVATPKLFANDGGTPLPSAGFLGFDSRSASN
jgi:hypothetical protein